MSVMVASELVLVWPGCSDLRRQLGTSVGAVGGTRVSASEMSGWALFVFGAGAESSEF